MTWFADRDLEKLKPKPKKVFGTSMFTFPMEGIVAVTMLDKYNSIVYFDDNTNIEVNISHSKLMSGLGWNPCDVMYEYLNYPEIKNIAPHLYARSSRTSFCTDNIKMLKALGAFKTEIIYKSGTSLVVEESMEHISKCMMWEEV